MGLGPVFFAFFTMMRASAVRIGSCIRLSPRARLVVLLVASLLQARSTGATPQLADVISRDPDGRTTVHATKLQTPIRIDGQLDESVYGSLPAITDFIQAEPHEGAPATEKTEVWIFFDGQQIYVAGRCWESQPDRMVVNEMRRDNGNILQNENIAFMFDTFSDKRNGVFFEVTPIGALMDGQFVNERAPSMDWNPIWRAEVATFDGGWTFETAVPFKSLRYGPGHAQTWGFNVRRYNKWKNEVSFLAPISNALGLRGIVQSSRAATLVGLEAPSGSRNLEVKPYAISNLTTDRAAIPKVSNDLGGDLGLDVKYGITQNLTADFTYNTDFAQVEADEQQVNLTRFSLFFPEKREFFLENQGLFSFGGGGGASPLTAGGSSGASNSDVPLLFYSRRIGLDSGRAVPLGAGGRATGRIGRFGLGLLNIQATDDPEKGAVATNFSVVRVKRDILRRSNIGALVTRRATGRNGADSNAYGIDGTFAFFQNLNINTYWSETRTEGEGGDGKSYRAQLDYAADRYGVQLERLVVGDAFDPGVGFVRRNNIRKNFGLLRFSPRPKSLRTVRRLVWTGSLAYIENGAGQLDTRDWDGEFAIEYQNSDRFSVGYSDTYELLPASFTIASGVTVPAGGYQSDTVRAAYAFGQQRKISGNVSAEHGTFYSGHKTTLAVSRGRISLTPRVSVEPTVSFNWVDLDEGSFTTNLVGSRATYTLTPRMFVSALVQYNSSSHSMASNVRLRWEYSPGSELFVVLNEQRDTLGLRFPDLANRAVIVKVNRLLRF